ncbi:phosphatase PAP2 family protein [Thermocatellispora tengchongensis]|uniref:phosphatase PAP2 family protein n=1 Tax=Thermocatellispora tengchongensis TaxID=1073253 RepID=UPI00161D046C|nr:phosphatase PAP2 family protein [Thermocatellispora tengchongensis]
MRPRRSVVASTAIDRDRDLRRRPGVARGMLGAGLVGAAACLVRADRALAAGVWRRRSPAMVAAARVVGALGDPKLAYPLAAVAAAAAVAGVTARPRVVRAGEQAGDGPLRLVAVVCASGAVRRLCCELVRRPRPPQCARLAPAEGYSLPSKHTALAVLAAGAIVRAAGLPAPARWTVPAAAGVTVGLCRVALGVHWPADVIAGLGFGLGCWWVADRIPSRPTGPHPPTGLLRVSDVRRSRAAPC